MIEFLNKINNEIKVIIIKFIKGIFKEINLDL